MLAVHLPTQIRFNKVHLFALQVFVLLEAMDVFSVMLIDLSYKSQVE